MCFFLLIMTYLGYASAIGLGYIHGNTKGAIQAGKLYQTYTNSMAPVPRGRPTKRPRPSTNSRPPRRQRVNSSGSYRNASRSVIRASSAVIGSRSRLAGSAAGSSIRLPRITKRERQPVVKRKKSVKVSSSFRAKTNVVIAEKKVKGIFITDQIEFMRVGLNGNVQDWAAFPNNVGSDPSHGQLFGLTRVCHAASRCWNNKLANSIPIITDLQMFGAGTDNTALSNYKFDVQKQWWEFHIKNNTHQTLNIKIHQCGHKKNGNYDDPLDVLNEGLVFDFNEKNVISHIATSGTGNTVLDDRTTLVKPELVSTFKGNYSTKTIVIILEPGQEYKFTVQGPAMLYDAKKFFSQTEVGQSLPIYNSKQKQDISLLWQVNTDMGGAWSESGDTRAYGQLPTPFITDADQAHGLIVRSQYHAKILMPEQVGFNKTPSTSGTVQQLDLRKSVVVMDDFKNRNDASFFSSSRIDPVQPTDEQDL